MVNKSMEEEGTRGKAMCEQFGGGKAVLKEGVDRLGQFFKAGHWHQGPVEANHQHRIFLHQLNFLYLKM